MVVPSTFDAHHPGFFISDTEEEDQGMVKNRRACSNCECPAHSTSNMRRGPSGNRSLCNACGLWYSRHGTALPVVPQALAPAAGKGVVSEIQATSVVQAIAATDALSSRSRDRHDSAWWFAHGLALNAIKSSQLGSLVDDEGIASRTTSAIPTIPNMSYVEQMESWQPFSFVHEERAYDSDFKRLPDNVKNEDFPVTSLTFRLGEENITFVSVSDFINFIINCELRGKSEYKASKYLQKCHEGLCEENDLMFLPYERLALLRKRGVAAVVFHFTYRDEKEGSKDVMIYESTIIRATEDPEMKVNGGIERLYSLRQTMTLMPTEQKEEHQPYIKFR
jgi:hypothetical protein